MNGQPQHWEDSDNVIPLRDAAPAWMDEEEAARWQDPKSGPTPEPEDDGPLPGAVDPSEWNGRNAPDRRFIIPGWIVRGHAGLLSGMEGVGKSLIAQQLATCVAIGREFLGLPVEQVNAVYITCEDSMDELWRRQEAINRSLGITMDDIAGKLKLVSIVGELGNELGTFSGDGMLSPSKRYRQIMKACIDFEAGFAVLDNAAHMFAGNENARHDVAAFLGMLERLSQVMDGAALLLAHPNKQLSQGNKQGNEYSGSTGWSAHVRNRLFLDYREDPEDGTPVDDDDRVLRKSKANYGKRGEEVFFRWHEWAFVRPADLGENKAAELDLIARTNQENEAFLRCLAERNKQRRAVSEKLSKSFAPAVFAAMPEARGVSKKRLEEAMDRLFRLKAIERGEVWKGPDRKPVFGLRQIGEVIENVAGIVAGNVQKMGAGNVHTMCGDHSGNWGSTHTPSTTYIGGSLEDPQSMHDGSPPDWPESSPVDEGEAWRANPLLNPDFGRE